MPISAAGNQPAPSDRRSKPPNNKSVNRSLSFLFLATFVSLSCKFYSAPRPQRPCVVIKSKKQQWFTDFSSSPIAIERRGGKKQRTTITLLSSIIYDVAITVLPSRSHGNNATFVLRRRRRRRGVGGERKPEEERWAASALTSPGSTAGRP